MTSRSSIKITPLTPRIGALVEGVDFTKPLTDEIFDVIHEAWMNHLVLFAHGPALTPEQHLSLGERFGPLHIHPAAPYAFGNPALMQIHTDASSKRNNGEGWHSDVSADLEPPMASILQIHQTPSYGGDTLWANMYLAFEMLSDPMQRMLEGLSATHSANYDGYYGDHQPQRENPVATHPVVRTHPVTGRSALFVNSGFTKRIEGLTKGESDALLDYLFEHIKNPNLHCRFQWQENAIAIWDNRCTQHMAVWDYYPETRRGIRVTVRGDQPFFKLRGIES